MTTTNPSPDPNPGPGHGDKPLTAAERISDPGAPERAKTRAEAARIVAANEARFRAGQKPPPRPRG